MCGVVGAIAQRNVVPILLEGLRRLEYRGYDSVGVAVVGEQGLARERSTERVAELVEQTRDELVLPRLVARPGDPPGPTLQGHEHGQSAIRLQRPRGA